MFGLFGPEKVEFIDFNDTILTYRSKKKSQKIGTPSKVAVQAELPTGPTSLKLSVVVDSVRPLPDKSSLIIAHVLAEPEELQQLNSIFGEVDRPDLGRLARRSERLPVGLRVLSQQLPGFRGVTIDLSLHGTQIHCDGLVDLNNYFDLTFELELADLPRLTLQAISIWSCADENRRSAYRAGLEFTQQHPETQVLWERAYSQLLRMKGASIMHRSIGSAGDPVSPSQD